MGWIDEDRLATMAQFLYDSGVLRGTDGQPLVWPGDVSDWFDQTWMTD